MNYCLYDIEKHDWLNDTVEARQAYHCLAVPKERKKDAELAVERALLME
jgi:hypothetical protein